MINILYGIIAFVLFFIFDIFNYKNKVIKKRFFGICGIVLIAYASIMAAIVSERLYIPAWISFASGILSVCAALMLVYSLFIELPFVSTYGKKQFNNTLIDIGTYALCRHPGVLWFGLMYFFYFLASGALLILFCGVIWTLMDMIYVYLQERYLFYKMFPEYERYSKTTPMLFPNKTSINKCICTIFKGCD